MESKPNENSVVKVVREEGKKTRKETQEIKTRLTQTRKDVNQLQKILTSKNVRAVLKLLKQGASR